MQLPAQDRELRRLTIAFADVACSDFRSVRKPSQIPAPWTRENIGASRRRSER